MKTVDVTDLHLWKVSTNVGALSSSLTLWITTTDKKVAQMEAKALKVIKRYGYARGTLKNIEYCGTIDA